MEIPVAYQATPPPEPFSPPPLYPWNSVPGQCPYHAWTSFTRRLGQLNWDWLGNVDVTRIGETGDVASIEYLMNQIAFANITERDTKEFRSRGALHAFMILQIAVEHLIRENAALRKASGPPITPDPDLTSQIELLKRDIRSRDVIIDNLTEQVESLRHERNEALAVNDTLRRREVRLGNTRRSAPTTTYTKRTPPSPERSRRRQPEVPQVTPKHTPGTMKLRWPADYSDYDGSAQSDSESDGWA